MIALIFQIRLVTKFILFRKYTFLYLTNKLITIVFSLLDGNIWKVSSQ